MKKLITVLSPLFCAAAIGLLPGCSKSNEAKPQSDSSKPGDASSPSPAAAIPSDSAELKVKWLTGKKYIMRATVARITDLTLPGQSQPQKQTMNLEQDFDISALKEFADGGHELELKFISQKMEVKIGDRITLSFDSAQPASSATDPTAIFLRKMVDGRLKYLTDADGKVKQIENLDAFINRVAGDQPQSKARFKQMFSEDVLKQYGSFGDSLPGRTVKLGDTWPVKKEVVTPVGMMTTDLKYTFKKWGKHNGRQCARLDYTGEMASKPGANGAPVAANVEDGKTSGENWFDPQLGMMVGETADLSMTMTVKSGGRIVPAKTSQTINIQLVDVEDIGK